MAVYQAYGDFLTRDFKDAELNQYINKELQPTDDFNDQMGKAVDRIATLLRDNVPLSVSSVFKSGSMAKGTAVRDKADADLVLYLNAFKNLDDVRAKRPGILVQLERELQKDGNTKVDGRNEFQVMVRTLVDGRSVDLDVLPAFDLLGSSNRGDIYRDMRRETSAAREDYSLCFASLQRDFIRSLSPSIKNLIRLVKHWRNVNFESTSGRPNSYMIELITVFAWEKAGKPHTFSTKKALDGVLAWLEDYTSIHATWDTYYNPDDYRDIAPQLKKAKAPFVLDPANPFNNVCWRCTTWDKVAEKATASRRSPLLANVDAANGWK